MSETSYEIEIDLPKIHIDRAQFFHANSQKYIIGVKRMWTT